MEALKRGGIIGFDRRSPLDPGGASREAVIPGGVILGPDSLLRLSALLRHPCEGENPLRRSAGRVYWLAALAGTASVNATTALLRTALAPPPSGAAAILRTAP
jgi:hypothetical protein